MITITNAHGTFTAHPLFVDLMIARHLPASPRGLSTLLAEHAEDIDWSDVTSVAEMLVILASFETEAVAR